MKADLITDIRGLFRARKKISYAGAVSHITQRAGGREPLFLEDADYLYALHLLKEKSKKFNFEIFCFTLMPNHLHLLIKQNEENLSMGMKNLFESYGVYFNHKYQRKGHVFCGAFRQSLCLDDSYMFASSLYIHLNPYKAGLVSAPWDWRWSSCQLYTEFPHKETFLNSRFILGMINKDAKRSSREYREILMNMANVQIKEAIEYSNVLEVFRGFMLQLNSLLFKEARETFNYKHLLDDKALEEEINNLKTKRWLRKPQDIKARKFLIEQLIWRGFSIPDISQRLRLARKTIYGTLRYE